MAGRENPDGSLLAPARLRRLKRWSLGSAKEELDFLLRQSVREHLISDVPLGMWASGGMDSSTILHYAAQATRRGSRLFRSLSTGGASTRAAISGRSPSATAPSTTSST